MQQQPPRRANGQASASPSREANIARDESVIEAMLASLARGGLETDAWESLYAEARRTDRLSELALAFEGVAQGKRLRAVQPAIAAEFLFQAGCFVGDVFGDAPSAAAYFERALAIAPTHAGSFAHLERILVNTRQWKRLADLFIGAAHQRPRGEQPALLRGATEALARAGDADNRMVEILGQIVRLDPGDEPSRVRLEAFFVRASRFRDVVALHERALAADPPLSFEARKSSLARVIELYAGQLQEPERALPHVEQLLAIEPAHAGARAVAQKLVVVKGLVGRAAAALATAFESTGPLVEVIRYLSIELETTRGPKRASLLARLGRLKQDGLADNLGAFEAFEQAVSIDADEEVRRRYVALASTLGRHIEASKVLARVVATAKDGASKARATAQLGGLLLGAGDAKRARGLLASVLGAADAPDDAVLAASQLLRDLLEPEKDRAALCDVLERLALLEPDADRRRMADERLSELAVLLGDTPRAVAAYERLLTTSARSAALEALMPHYEQSGDPLKYAQLLEARARDTADESEARALWMTAARVRATETKDAAAAIATCRTVIGRYMAEKDILAILVPLLEGQGMWHELADALASEVALTTGPDRARVLYRLGSVKLLRLHDRPGAIDAFAAALASDPEEKPARQALEKLASTGDSRLLAARAIERTVRSEGARGPLLRILEVVGSLAPDVDERLAALREAVELASAGSPQEASRVVDLVARALGDASGGRRPIGEWLVHLDRVAPRATDSKRRAAILEAAVAQHEVDTPERSFVAKLAAEALVASGDGPGAVALYRRALAFEPHSSELLARIDDLLRDQGSPAARVALYRAALAGASPARRRELLHRIGGIERHDLHDSAAAVATFRSALDDDPDDADAFAALEELYRQGERWSELAALIEQGLSRSVGLAAQVLRAKLAPLLALHGDRDRAKTHSAILLEDPDLAPDHFDLIARAAELLGDVDMACVVLRRRVASAQELHEQIAWLDRLGEAEQDLRGDLRASADAWKQAAKLAETCGDDESARRLYSRARKVAPDDAEVTARLVALCEKGEIWSELPPLYVALAHHASNDGERVSLALRTAQVLFERIGDSRSAARHASRAFDLAPNRADVLEAFERMTIASRAIDEFEEAVREALRRSTGEEEHRESSRESPAGHQPATAAPTRLALLFAQARVLASDPVRVHDAIGLYRSLLGDSTCLGTDQASALDGLESLLAQEHEPAHRVGDRRWLLEWRAEHASEAQRVERLLDWARQEEAAFSDPDRALAIHRRILTVDPECDEALASVARLALSMGDVEQALGALGVRRGFAEGAARVIIERQAAQILMSRTDRWEDALASLGAVLADAPGDPLARELLAQLLAHPGARARAADLLEHAYEGVDDVDVREDILRTLLSAGADSTEPEVRERRFQRLCDLQCGAGRVEAALVSALQAAREMPEFSSLWGRAEDMARILARPDDLASLYEEVLGSPISSANAVAIGERAVAFFEEWFDDSGRVVPLLTRVLDLAPDAEWAFERLKLLLDGGERWDELFSLYDRVLLSVSGSRREALLEDAAQIAKDFADRPDRATGYFEELRRLRPTDAKLASALERLYDRQGRHRALVFLLESRLPELDAEEAGRLRVRIAGLWLDELCDPANALDVLEPLLARAGAVQMGLAASAWVVLERILDAASPPSAGPAPDRAASHGFEAAPSPTSIADPAGGSFAEQAPPHATPAPVRYRAAEWLRRHYASTGRDDALARILTIELERVSDRSERVRRLVALAELCEKIGDDESAFEHVGRAVVLAPEDDDIRRRLSEIAEKTNRLGRLADVIADAADAAESEVLRVSLVLGAADIRAGRLADSLGATAILFSVLNEGRLGDDRALLVARRLSPLLRETGRLAEQLDVVERIAGLEKDAAAASEALGYGARLALDLGQISRGIELWERRLRANELDTEALDALAERLEREGRNERLAEILELRATAASDPSLRRADLVRVAALVGSAEDGCDRAISVWRRIEDEFGLGEDTATALAGLFESTGRWPDLAGLLVRSARVAPDRFTRAERWGLLGDVQRGRLNSPEAAVDAYREALAADSGHAVARAGLELLAREPAVRGAAVGALLAVLRERAEWRASLE